MSHCLIVGLDLGIVLKYKVRVISDIRLKVVLFTTLLTSSIHPCMSTVLLVENRPRIGNKF